MKTILLSTLLLAAPAAADGPKKPKGKAADFGTLDLPALPKGDGMSQTKSDAPESGTRAPADPSAAKYSLVSVAHAQQFVARGEGHDARHPISRIDVVNLPMTVPPFQTLVVVKSPDKLGAAIEVRLLDPQGSQVVSSQGALEFGGHDTADFLVDWDPFTLRKAGAYQVEVTVAGQSLGKQPFPVSQELSAKLVATPVDAGPTPEAPKETWP